MKLALALVLVALTGGAAAAGSGTTVTPDSKTTLVQKDVGGMRWAISRSRGDGTVSGNVFDPAGGDAQFVWCAQKSENGDSYTYSCSGASSCQVSNCPETWGFIADVDLPKSFFAAGSDVGPTPTPTPAPSQCPANGPIEDLRVDCSSLVYLYSGGGVVAGISSTGGLAAACISDGNDVICFRGPVTSSHAATLTQTNLNAGPFIPLDGGSSLSINGSTLDIYAVLSGKAYPFSGFHWFKTEPANGSSEVASLFAPRGSRSALQGALEAAGAGEAEAVRGALARLAAAAQE